MFASDFSSIFDRRELLRIKLKSLAAEAAIIRHEEQRQIAAWRSTAAFNLAHVEDRAARRKAIRQIIKRAGYLPCRPEDVARSEEQSLQHAISALDERFAQVKRDKPFTLQPVWLFAEMRDHRVKVVRKAAREAAIAYGIIRGRAYAEIEPTALKAPDWEQVKRLLKAYGPKGLAEAFQAPVEMPRAERSRRSKRGFAPAAQAAAA